MQGFEYYENIKEIMDVVVKKNENTLKELANKIFENIRDDHIIHTFGTGHSHMIGIELFARAGGLGNVNALLDPDVLTAYGARRSSDIEKLSGMSDIIFDHYKIDNKDMMIISSNSGRNAMPIEMALRCKKEGVFVVGVTNVAQSITQTSRHSSGKRLFELCDLVLDTCVPMGDASLDIDGIKTGPASSIVSMLLLNIAVSEAIKLCIKNNVRPLVFQSQNVDGFDNDTIYNKYESLIKHF